ncbi:MAG: Flp pilus assembly protein CpaB [Elusimicrobia bacterium]|nr:Flp pilus assembly protein CpaB [Elusimicrobiota bacterium]
MNKKFQILISVFAGIAAAILIAGYVNSLETKYKKAAKKVPVVITKKYIDAGEMISPEDVEVKLIPQEYLQPRAIQKAQDLLTEKGFLLYMAAVPLDKGEQVVGTKLFPLGQGTGVASVVPAGMRAVTIIMNRREVSKTLIPGNRVDILATFDYYDAKGKRHEETRTILQNVPVLAVGKAVIGTVREVRVKGKRSAARALASVEETESQIPVSVAVTPAQAELLVLAKNKGAIDFVVRAVGDDNTYTLSGASMNKIFAKYGETEAGHGPQVEYLKALQKQQEEALKLLKKYKKFR